MSAPISDLRAHALTSDAVAVPASAPSLTIAFFGHDSDESTVIKRARSFQAHGARVVGFMFRRERNKRNAGPEWENVALGLTVDRNYLFRLPKLLLAVWKAVRERRLLKQCHIIHARNLDMLLIAVMAKTLSGAKAPIVYEVLDIRPIFLRRGLAGRLFRWVERKLMAKSSLFVTSAPEFVTQYFKPAYGFGGRWFLLENKLAKQTLGSHILARRSAPPPGPPWVIGMFGVLRCTRSLDLLCHLAEQLGDRVRIDLRGILSETDIPAARMDAIRRRLPNVHFGGPYVNPQDLPEIYGRVHFVWASDFLDPGGNSEWCLTNRIYEGGLMGAVLLGARGVATGRMIEERRLGFTFGEPLKDEAVAFMQSLDQRTYCRAREAVRAADPSLFIDETDTRDLLRQFAGLVRQGAPAFVFAAVCGLLNAPAAAQEQPHGAPSFFEPFDRLDAGHWFTSNGWANGAHQNCTWSQKNLRIVEGVLELFLSKNPENMPPLEKPSEMRDFSCAEVQTHKSYGYGTYEIRMSAAAAPGLVSAFFTYVGPTAHEQHPHDEIDFEFLGKDTRSVQLNYFGAAQGQNERMIDLGFDAAQEMADYAFEWRPDSIRWFVNGALVHEAKREDGRPFPARPGKIMLSIWGSDNLDAWLASFDYPGTPLIARYDWVAFTRMGEDCRFPQSILCRKRNEAPGAKSAGQR